MWLPRMIVGLTLVSLMLGSGITYAQAGDTTAPTTTATLAPVANANGWHNTDVDVTLTSVDPTPSPSGVKQIGYFATGATPIGQTTSPGASKTITFSAEGISPLSFFGIDNAGNTEKYKSLIIKIDKTEPVTTASAPPPPTASGWYRGSVKVRLAGTSGGTSTAPVVKITSSQATFGAGGAVTSSGPTDVNVANTNGVTYVDVTGEGLTTLSFFATDAADNVEELKADTQIRIDKSKPTCVGTNIAGGRRYTIKDAASGLTSITHNLPGGFTVKIPSFTAGTNTAQTVEISPAPVQGSQPVQGLTITDQAGISAFCR